MSFALPFPPVPKTCPVCGGKLITRKQVRQVLVKKWTKKYGWTKDFGPVSVKRRVCTRCKIAVVVHRLQKSPG